MKYNKLLLSSENEECFLSKFATLKGHYNKLFYSNLNKIEQNECCDPVINI